MQFQKTPWTDRRPDGRPDGQKDRQTLFYRTLPATAMDSKQGKVFQFYVSTLAKTKYLITFHRRVRLFD